MKVEEALFEKWKGTSGKQREDKRGQWGVNMVKVFSKHV
jgi:hypothetical protein